MAPGRLEQSRVACDVEAVFVFLYFYPRTRCGLIERKLYQQDGRPTGRLVAAVGSSCPSSDALTAPGGYSRCACKQAGCSTYASSALYTAAVKPTGPYAPRVTREQHLGGSWTYGASRLNIGILLPGGSSPGRPLPWSDEPQSAAASHRNVRALPSPRRRRLRTCDRNLPPLPAHEVRPDRAKLHQLDGRPEADW